MTFRWISSSRTIAFVVVLLLVASSAEDANNSNTDGEYLNVYGQALQSCSSDGMALTGYTRSGYCVDKNDDSGSHHVCIDLSSLGGGNGENQNFCDVTGQSDWCSSTGSCHEDQSDYSCPVTNWCVCQWAFASYVKNSGGCGNIQTVVCESINQQALLAYQKIASQWSSDPKYQTALECLVDRCGLDASLYSSSVVARTKIVTRRTGAFAAGLGLGLAVLGGYAYYRKRVSSQTILLNQSDGMVPDAAESSTATGSKLL